MSLKSHRFQLGLLCFLCLLCSCYCDTQAGPDPWNLDDEDLKNSLKNDVDVPPDLKIYPKKKVLTETTLGAGEWFFRRILSIVLKGGQIKKNDDDTVDISLQMRLTQKQWQTLENYMQTTTALTEDMYRRSVGYIEEAIYQPSIADKIVMAWSDYIEIYLIEYKDYITWTLAVIGFAGIIFWLWNRMSHKHFVIIIFLLLYFYEVFVSYKEAEKQELDRFIVAVNNCRWAFWSSSCELPKPDLLIFLKHMNPLKIAVRMFTTVISEPLISFSDVLKTMVHGVTDGLWYPFDKIVYGILIIFFNVLLLFLIIMIVFNFILNIPIDLSFLGIISLGLRQRHRNLFSEASSTQQNIENSDNRHTDRISGATLDRLLDVCSRALSNAQSKPVTDTPKQPINSKHVGIRRSASTGRLSDLASSSLVVGIPRKRNVAFKNGGDGSGDAR